MVEEEDIKEKEENLEEPEEPKEPESKEPEESLEGFDELMGKSVAEIVAIAKEKGLNSRDYLTKDDAVKAILEVPEAENPEE